MTFTVEDGTIIAGANSYVSLIAARAYALDRGVTLSAVDAELEVTLVQAADWVESYRSRFKGELTSADQEMSWPRAGAYYETIYISSVEIPETLKRAQIEAAIAIQEDDLTILPNGIVKPVRREKVGQLETEYDTRHGNTGFTPRLTAAEGLLAPILSGGMNRTVRA
jgi:hypothetical protein